MSLHKTLNEIVRNYKSDIVMIRDFVASLYETIDDLSKVAAKYKHRLTSDDTKAMRALRDVLDKSLDEWPKQKENGTRILN